MKLDLKGIKFNTWLYFFLFAIGIVALLGFLQLSLIRPYYRNDKIATVKNVADKIQEYLIDNPNTSQAQTQLAFQANVDNNVCSVIYNGRGDLVYSADTLGAGCVFNQNLEIDNQTITPNQAGAFYVEQLTNSDGDYSLNLVNSRTDQDMIVYGRIISSNLGNYYVLVNSPLEPVDSIISFFRSQYFVYVIVVMILSIFVSLFFSSKLSKPIVNMKHSADHLAQADYNVRFDGSYFSETNELASTLNDATDKLSKVDELRKDLIANMSHDIKTPLTNIKAYAEMIRDISGDNPQKRDEHLDVIIDEVDYLDHLVVDMSQLSKMESGNYELKQVNFDIAEKVRDIVKMNQALTDELKLTINIEAPDTLTVYADETKIGQVIYNFFSNAIKHSKEGSTIILRLMRKEDVVHFEVEDHGDGISESDLPYIWDRYYKIDKQFSRNIESTGLGLAIVKAILDTHHAKYGVNSKVGEGSIFWFELEQENVL